MIKNKIMILVVDDLEKHAFLISGILKKMGYVCDIALSLEEARTKLLRSRQEDKLYDCVIADLELSNTTSALDLLDLIIAIDKEMYFAIITNEIDFDYTPEKIANYQIISKREGYKSVTNHLSQILFKVLSRKAHIERTTAK
jgi:DNA-binding NtrC family response regulator